MDPSYSYPGVTVVINIAGVDAILQSTVRTPAAVRPLMTAAFRAGPVSLESIPTATVSSAAALLSLSDSQPAKAPAMVSTLSPPLQPL